jgi:hypothetical protein
MVSKEIFSPVWVTINTVESCVRELASPVVRGTSCAAGQCSDLRLPFGQMRAADAAAISMTSQDIPVGISTE